MLRSKIVFSFNISNFLRKHFHSLLLLYSTLGIYFFFFITRVLYWSNQGLMVGNLHFWGDLPIHLAIISMIAYREPSEWFSYHPVFAGGKFTYPFVSDMVSGLLLRNGLDLVPSILIPTLILFLLLIFLMYYLFFQIHNSSKKAMGAVFIFFLSSGPGFLRFFNEWLKAPSLGSLFYSTVDYTAVEKSFWLAGNVVHGLLLPQRPFLFGMTLSLLILNGLFYLLAKPSRHSNLKANQIKFLLLGVLAGILPIVHVHSFIVVTLLTGAICLTFLERLEEWFYYFVPAAILSNIFFLLFIAGGIENSSFAKLFIGWGAHGKDLIAWVDMWLEIWGVMLPLALLGYFFILRKKNKLSICFFAVFFGLFILANVFLFQPIEWDNSKIFFWCYLAFSALAIEVLSYLWSKNISYKLLAILLFMFLTLTGALQLIWIQQVAKNEKLIIKTEDVILAEQVRANTKENAIFLTAPNNLNPIALLGAKPIVLGNPVWAYSYGFLFEQRLSDVNQMYQGGVESLKLIKDYKVSYVLIGEREKDLNANEEFFSQNFPLEFQNSSYRIYNTQQLFN